MVETPAMLKVQPTIAAVGATVLVASRAELLSRQAVPAGELRGLQASGQAPATALALRLPQLQLLKQPLRVPRGLGRRPPEPRHRVRHERRRRQQRLRHRGGLPRH